MKDGRSVLGLVAGVALALGLIALSSSGFIPLGTRAPASTANVSLANSTSPGLARTAQAPTTGVPPSQVSSIAKQPIGETGFVLLPILAAVLIGLAIYGMSDSSRLRTSHSGP